MTLLSCLFSLDNPLFPDAGEASREVSCVARRHQEIVGNLFLYFTFSSWHPRMALLADRRLLVNFHNLFTL